MSDRRFRTEDPAFEAELVRALADTVRVVEGAGLRYLAAGAIAMTAYRKGSWPVGGGDIDLLLPEEDARKALDALAAFGFHAEPCIENWLCKATKGPILIDLIYVAGGNRQAPDDEMIQRGRDLSVAGIPLKAIAAEDYVVMQSLATKRAAPNYWFDAIELVPEIRDWDYLLRRAQVDPRRVLSVLSFALSEGRQVPPEVLRALLERIEQQLNPQATLLADAPA